jgi:hypothetical protein
MTLKRAATKQKKRKTNRRKAALPVLLRMAIMAVGPKQAAKWLEQNESNRRIRDSLVQQYARDMKAGRWRTNHQGIAVTDDGALLDGQHRLSAIVESGCTIDFVVFFYRRVTPEDVVTIDGGCARSAHDQATIVGMKADQRRIAIANTMLKGRGRTARPTRMELLEFYRTHEEAVNFAVAILPKVRRVTTAANCAVFARAFYTADHGRLIRAASLFTTCRPPEGEPESAPGDASILTVYKWLTTGTSRLAGGARIQEQYDKVERALSGFLSRQDLTKLYGAEEELFPIPGDNGQMTLA